MAEITEEDLNSIQFSWNEMVVNARRNPMAEITEEDLRSIRYFWNKKEDVTRWCDWEAKLPALRREYPAIVKAWEDLRTAEQMMNAVVRGICE